MRMLENGLHLSWPKTKVQNLGFGDPESDMTLYGNTVEGVTEFCYLGSIIYAENGCAHTSN